MTNQETTDVVDFEISRMLVGLSHSLERPLAASKSSLIFEFGPEIETILRGNCQRLGETLKNLVKGAIAYPDYGNVLMVIHTEQLGTDRVLLKFEIRSFHRHGPTFRFYAGLPRAMTQEGLRPSPDVRA